MDKRRETVLKTLAGCGQELRRLGVTRLSLFGSVARDEAADASDVDVLVDLERHTFDAYFDLKEYLEELLGCRVDVVMEDALKPRLRPTVQAEAIRVPGF